MAKKKYFSLNGAFCASLHLVLFLFGHKLDRSPRFQSHLTALSRFFTESQSRRRSHVAKVTHTLHSSQSLAFTQSSITFSDASFSFFSGQFSKCRLAVVLRGSKLRHVNFFFFFFCSDSNLSMNLSSCSATSKFAAILVKTMNLLIISSHSGS